MMPTEAEKMTKDELALLVIGMARSATREKLMGALRVLSDTPQSAAGSSQKSRVTPPNNDGFYRGEKRQRKSLFH